MGLWKAIGLIVGVGVATAVVANATGMWWLFVPYLLLVAYIDERV